MNIETATRHPASSTAGACDAVTLEISQGAIQAAQGEMEALIERTAISALIREKKDFPRRHLPD